MTYRYVVNEIQALKSEKKINRDLTTILTINHNYQNNYFICIILYELGKKFDF